MPERTEPQPQVTRTEYLVLGRAVFEICMQTDKQTYS